jgi:hypothetical protein
MVVMTLLFFIYFCACGVAVKKSGQLCWKRVFCDRRPNQKVPRGAKGGKQKKCMMMMNSLFQP